ncbi:hypothetical protein B0H10DRAFT_2109574 [Mycena sp. CBHHK59/15]|nr:hypothetical protein B0H10DRAFT_2109574 [Mycena sp. CBHHK59/15]
MPIRKRDTQEGIVHTADGAGRGNARNRAEGTRTGEKCRRVLVRGVQTKQRIFRVDSVFDVPREAISMPIRKRDTQEGIVHTADGAGWGNARNRAEGTRTGEKCRRVLVRGVQRAEEVALDIYGVGTRTS